MLEPGPVLELDGFTFRQRRPAAATPPRVIVMLHGWTGDENAMWIFAAKLPPDAWLIAPRGLHALHGGGFSWTNHRSAAAQPPMPTEAAPQAGLPSLEDFRPAVERLLAWLTPRNFPQANLEKIDLVGFSQGAALAFSLALLHPQRVRSVAALSGFLPLDAQPLIENRPLQGMPVFLAHGSEDAIVPVMLARLAAERLDAAGAQVSYCEDVVGHKLSATCFRSLADFYAIPEQ